MPAHTPFKPTSREKKWLETLAKRVHAGIRKNPEGSALCDSDFGAELTGDGDSGWWVSLGLVRGTRASLCLFIDDTRAGLRTLWYGAAGTSRAALAPITEVGLGAWPLTQESKGGELPTGFRYNDPWLDGFDRGEVYYGWVVREEPDTSEGPTDTLVARIVDDLRILLQGAPGTSDAATALQQMDHLDDIRLAAVRREQGVLKRLLFDGRKTGDCAICGRNLSTDLLVVAHINRRAECEPSERKNLDNLLVLCALGCDDLFERGYLVGHDGYCVRGPRTPATKAVRDEVAKYDGKAACKDWSRRAPFFAMHRERITEALAKVRKS